MHNNPLKEKWPIAGLPVNYDFGRVGTAIDKRNISFIRHWLAGTEVELRTKRLVFHSSAHIRENRMLPAVFTPTHKLEINELNSNRKG